MTAELVPVQNMADIEALDPASREVAVTHMLAEARSWLAHAVETTGPQRIAEFKAFVATVAETARQLQLSKEIQLDAQEMVRRAERGVGQAIRKGQAEGTVRTARENDGAFYGNQHADSGLRPEETKASTAPFFKCAAERAAVYDLTDDVTDEQFDQAIGAAKDEGNLSRVNVVRKVRGEATTSHAAGKPTARPEVLRKTRHLDPVRVISETCYALDGLRHGVERLKPHHFAALDPTDVDAWASSLSESLRSLNRLNRQLKELNQA